ncbi:hypothetical protein GTQ99_19480 [Kineococcus sp. T13]|uniref:hypothetical protein n=1 Tax=Kineococcus vitellinus TaxID=2696565 RepID=UPI001412F681|nr:hypothetical protein [Kineococcus vitellinus]NAZ77575.1 hypothetical protein [Kineococcus vitellinus]
MHTALLLFLLLLLALGALCAAAAISGGRRAPAGCRLGPRTRRRRWVLAALALLLTGSAVTGLITAPQRATPPSASGPLSRSGVAASYGPRCEELLEPFAVVPDADVGPAQQLPFWAGYLVALRTVTDELRALRVDAGAQPAVDDVISALVARTASLERELQIWSNGVPEDMAAAIAASADARVRDSELMAAFDDLGLDGCGAAEGGAA